MSAEESSQGGLGKSIVLLILGLFVLYYGIKVMQGRDHQESHGEAHHDDLQVEDAGFFGGASEEKTSKSKASQGGGPDVASLMAENAKLKQDVADLQEQLYQNQQKLGAVRKLLQAEALTSQE